MGKKMISATTLAGYLYCQRKLYLQYVLKIAPPPKDVLVKGSVNHEVFDRINQVEENIIKSIRKFPTFGDLFALYRSTYYGFLVDTLKKREAEMKEVGLVPMELFHKSWPMFLREAQIRASNVLDFIKEHKVLGDELWRKLTPKYLTELRIESEKLGLKGIIDKIEVRDNKFIPFELKTGRLPKTLVWEGHRIQVAVYALLLEEKFMVPVNEAIVDYVEHSEKRKVMIDQETREMVFDLIIKVNALLESKEIPPIVENRNKCKACSLKEKCYGL